MLESGRFLHTYVSWNLSNGIYVTSVEVLSHREYYYLGAKSMYLPRISQIRSWYEKVP